jgi:glycerophosphoryl diester phosphodiesterase
VNLIWSDIRLLFGRFASNWRQFLAIHLIVNILIFVFLAPAVMLMLRLAITLSGDVALSDEDILFFILSPVGLVSFIILASAFSIIIFLEHAALITAAWCFAREKPVSVRWILTSLALQAPRLFRLAALVLLRVVLNSMPFLLLLALVYQLLLSDYDINYYLTAKPPEWRVALIWAALIALAWGIHLLRLFVSWVFCLPLLLLIGVRPSRSLHESSKATRGQRSKIAAWILGWLLLSTLAAMAASALVATTGSFFIHISVESESMKALLLTLSLVSMFGYLLSFAVTFISTSLLGLLTMKMFLDNGPGSMEPEFFPAPGQGQFLFPLNRRVLAGGLIAGFIVALIVVNSLLKNLEFEGRTEIMAHRGASLVAPENTMAAVRAAIDSGAQWVEVDVQETADGEVIVIHDSDLKKIGRVPLAVATSTLVELQEIDIGSWFGEEFSDQRIPTLEQVLRLCKDRIRVNIELKYYGAQQQLEQRVADIVDANAMADQVIIMSLRLDGIRAMHRLRPDWTLGLLTSVAVGNLAALEVDFLAINARFASRHLIRRMHDQGKEIMVWTVNDPVGMSAMASRGADVIITDEPALGVSLMKQHKQLEPAERLLMQLADIFQKPSLYREQ